MSSRDQTTAAALATAAVALDGLLTGVALAYFAVQSWTKYLRSSSALTRVSAAPSSRISDLRSLLSDAGDHEGEPKLVVVRGEVQPRWAPWPKGAAALVSQGSGEKAVIIQRTSTCLYSEWRGVFGWRFDLHTIFSKRQKERYSTSMRTVPFVLVEGGDWSNADFVNVKLEGSKHSLPLLTVYHQLLPIRATTFSFFQALFGQGYPVALLDEEKILPVGSEVTAVGLCSLQDGNLEIKPSDELPFFLSYMTESEMEAELANSMNVYFWSGIVLGVVSAGVLCYALKRNWGRLKQWINRRHPAAEETARAAVSSGSGDDDPEEVPDGELCVICLTRRRKCVFIPCGHRVCCCRCAEAVKREHSPKCPMCRQDTSNFVRVYDS